MSWSPEADLKEDYVSIFCLIDDAGVVYALLTGITQMMGQYGRIDPRSNNPGHTILCESGTPNRSRPAGPPDYYCVRVRARPRSTACTRDVIGWRYLPPASRHRRHTSFVLSYSHSCVCVCGVGRVSILIIIRIIFERIKCQIYWAFKYPAAKAIYKYV